MNEISKLISSLLLLGVGFVAASLVGPPEFVGRLSHYLQPQVETPPDSLRPLASNSTVPGQRTDGWPALPTPTAEAAATSMNRPTTPPSAIESAASSPWGNVAQVSTNAPAASWIEAEPAATRDAMATSTDLDSGWLTASNFGVPAAPLADTSRYESTPSRGQLTPVQRGANSASNPELVASIDPIPTWPELRAPESPVDLSAPLLAEQTAELRSLPETSPYGERPRFEATSSADTSWNPLRTEAARPQYDPVDRQPVAATYTQHVVTDGDTLASLAKRYLGEPSRAGELFELNRDRLEHPDVLPIGMVLLTPELAHRGSTPQAPAPNAFPALRPDASDFATVSAHSPLATQLGNEDRRALTPINVTAGDRPLTDAQRLGPVNPRYNSEVSWDANRW